MAQKPTLEVSSVASQRDRRYTDTCFDQHKSSRFPNGRPWWGHREFAANIGHRDGFTGGDLLPGNHDDPFGSTWHAPWLPEGRYFDFNYIRNKITIRYDRIVADDTAAMNTYYDAASRIAYQASDVPPEYGSLPKQAIIAVIGLPPRSPRVAQAAQAGDPWLLGQTDEVNEELARLLGLSRRGFPLGLAATPLTTPEAVLATSPDALQAMIAAAVSAALAEREAAEAAKTAKNKEKMANVRAARGSATAGDSAA